MKWLLCDFHVHTKMSDGWVPLLEPSGENSIIDIFGKGGVDVLNVADHLYDTISDHGKRMHRAGKNIDDWDVYTREIEKAKRYARERYNMLVIRGSEITNYIDGFHIVAVDLKKPVDANLRAEEVIKEIHRQGGVAISAHPYDRSDVPGVPKRGYVFHLWDHLPQFRDVVDLWEIGNGNILYEKVAEEKLRFVADSDFHHTGTHDHPNQFYSWKTLVNARKNISSIKKALLEQNVAIIKVINKNRL